MWKKFSHFLYRNRVALITTLVISIFFIILGWIAEFSPWHFYYKKYLPNVFLNEFWDYMSAPIVALIVGFIITRQYNLKQLDITNQNRIDDASGWRKELMNIASKTNISSDDIHRIRSSLRYLPKDNKQLIEKFIDDHKLKINDDKKNEIIEYIDKKENIGRQNNNELFQYYRTCIKNFQVEINSIYEKKKWKRKLKKDLINLEFNLMTNLIIDFCDFLSDYSFDSLSIKYSKILRLLTRYLLKHHWEYYANLTNTDNNEDYISSMESVALDVLKEVEKIYNPPKSKTQPAPHTNSN